MGETSPNIMGRFSNSPNIANKKYSGTAKGPMSNSTNSGNRNSQARQRLLASKISAPRPINLPSLRREHASGGDIIVSSSAGSPHIWGSVSPSLSRSESDSTDPTGTSNSSQVANTETHRAWANPSITQSKLKPITKTIDEPVLTTTILEEKPLESNTKEIRGFDALQISHQPWDEMVSEEIDDFSVNVVEFDDGTKVTLDTTEVSMETQHKQGEEEKHVNKKDHSHPTAEKQNNHFPTTEKHQHHSGMNGERSNNYRSTFERRPTSSEKQYRHSFEKQNNPSEKWHDNRKLKKLDGFHVAKGGAFHPTPPLHQQSSEHREEHTPNHDADNNTAENNPIVTPKNSVVLTAVERAKKRRDEQEAEFQAAAERARQKAAALAAQQKHKEEIEDSCNLTKDGNAATENLIPETKKPWNLVAGKVDTLTTDQSDDSSQEESSMNAKDHVEVVDFSQNEEWGAIPDHLLNGRHREQRGWIKNEDHSMSIRSRGSTIMRGRGRGRVNTTTEHWRQQQEEPVVIEILKHEPVVVDKEEEIIVTYRDKIDDLLKKTTSPLLPEHVARSLVKKPANLSFMVEVEESDAEITKEYTEEEEVIVEEDINEPTPVEEMTSTVDSANSTPSGIYVHPGSDVLASGLDPNTRMSMGSNYPLFVYQYPIAPAPEDARHHNGFPPQPMGVYLMPQQQYVTNNQYMVPYHPQVGSANALYYPTLSWQHPQHYSPRPHYKPRRPYHNNHHSKQNNGEWQPYHYNNTRNSFQSRPYRGRGGFHSYHNKRHYPTQDNPFESPSLVATSSDDTTE